MVRAEADRGLIVAPQRLRDTEGVMGKGANEGNEKDGEVAEREIDFSP